jgi:hypothetical protein
MQWLGVLSFSVSSSTADRVKDLRQRAVDDHLASGIKKSACDSARAPLWIGGNRSQLRLAEASRLDVPDSDARFCLRLDELSRDQGTAVTCSVTAMGVATSGSQSITFLAIAPA